MHAKDLLECRNKIIEAFKDGTFRSEHLKELDNAAHEYTLKDVNKSINEIRSIEEKINLSLFKEFFELPSPAKYAKMLINTKNRNENKEAVEEMEYKISDLKEKIEKISKKEKIEKMSKKEKKDKNADQTLEIITKILDWNKQLKIAFIVHQKLVKKNQNQRLKKDCKEDNFKNKRITKIKKEEKNIKNELFKKYFTNYQSPSDMYKQ